MVTSRSFRVVALVVPAVGVLAGAPLALAPFAGDPRGVFGPYFLTAIPVYAALLAAPGYLSCVFQNEGARASSAARRWWIRGSLLVATLVCGAAIWGATLMFLFAPPALVTLVCVVYLWTRFERASGQGGAPEHRGSRNPSTH